MALLSNTERAIIQMHLSDRHLNASQRGSLLRELERDDESRAEGSVDSRYAIPIKR